MDVYRYVSINRESRFEREKKKLFSIIQSLRIDCLCMWNQGKIILHFNLSYLKKYFFEEISRSVLLICLRKLMKIDEREMIFSLCFQPRNLFFSSSSHYCCLKWEKHACEYLINVWCASFFLISRLIAVFLLINFLS